MIGITTTSSTSSSTAAAASPPTSLHATSSIDASGGDQIRKTCPICYDDFLVNEASEQSLLATLPCQQLCCRECLYQHCQYWITLHKVPVLCPLHVGAADAAAPNSCGSPSHADSRHHKCSTPLSNALVHDIVCSCHIHSNTTTSSSSRQRGEQVDHNEDDRVVCKDGNNSLWNKYVHCQQKQQRRSDPALRRTCSSCQASFSASYYDDDEEEDEKESTTTICAMCRHAMILNSTTTTTTASTEDDDQHLVMEIQDLLAAQQILKSMPIKPCSHCYMPLNKTGGCDHVVCPACHEDMCYKCGTHEFLQGESYVISCSRCRQDFVDHRQLPRYRLMCFCVYLPLYMPILFVYMILSTLLGMVSLAMSVLHLVFKVCSMLWNLKSATTTTTTASVKTLAMDNSSSSSRYLIDGSPKSTGTDSKNLPVWKRVWFGLRLMISFPWLALLQQQCCGEQSASASTSTSSWWSSIFFGCGKDCRGMVDDSSENVELKKQQEDPLSLLLVSRRRPVMARGHHQVVVVSEHDHSYNHANDLNV